MTKLLNKTCMQKVLAIFCLFVLLIIGASFSQPNKEKVKWLSIAEMQAAYAKQPKPILMDVYTSWCGWCKVMDRETYSNPKVAAYLNEHYYAVKFDAEQKDSIVWNGQHFGYNPNNKVHDLAVYLMFGQMSYPTTIFLPELTARPAPLPGYLKPKELETPVKFFGDGAYKNSTFPDFAKGFKGTW